MESLIQVFRMSEVSPETRCKIIIKLGKCINDDFSMNITEGLVYELVKQLCPNHEILLMNKYKDA